MVLTAHGRWRRHEGMQPPWDCHSEEVEGVGGGDTGRATGKAYCLKSLINVLWMLLQKCSTLFLPFFITTGDS